MKRVRHARGRPASEKLAIGGVERAHGTAGLNWHRRIEATRALEAMGIATSGGALEGTQ
jgi:hypothetical protein